MNWRRYINIGEPVLTEKPFVFQLCLHKKHVQNQNVTIMKTLITSVKTNTLLLAFALCTMGLSLHAQNEQKGFSFQGYARDFGGAAYSSQNITAQFTLYPDGEATTYQEQQNLTTDAYGVFHAEIGKLLPANFAAIDFSAKKYFMQVEVKIPGGEFVEISNAELLAVPYAKGAENAINAQVAQNAVKADNGNPTGTVISYAGATAPTGYLVCDGTSVLRADYPELFAAIGTAWGSANASEFNLPDLRGQFLRGQDGGVGVDPDRASRTALNTGGITGDEVGSYQSHQFASHSHTFTYHPAQVNGWNNGDNAMSNIGDPNHPQSSTKGTSGAGGSETRPKNAYVLFVIKY
jgi:microcystin-dependent protein